MDILVNVCIFDTAITTYGNIIYTTLYAQAVSEQPVANYFMADATFLNYAGGIYSPTTCTSATNHNMLIVGYDTTGPVPFWIVKNSWGEAGSEGQGQGIFLM